MRAKYGDDWREKGIDDDQLMTAASGGIDHGHIFGIGAAIDRRKLPAGSSSASTRSTASYSSHPVRIMSEETVAKMLEEHDRKRDEDFQRRLEEGIRQSQQQMFQMLMQQRPTFFAQPDMTPQAPFSASVGPEWQNIITQGNPQYGASSQSNPQYGFASFGQPYNLRPGQGSLGFSGQQFVPPPNPTTSPNPQSSGSRFANQGGPEDVADITR